MSKRLESFANEVEGEQDEPEIKEAPSRQRETSGKQRHRHAQDNESRSDTRELEGDEPGGDGGAHIGAEQNREAALEADSSSIDECDCEGGDGAP